MLKNISMESLILNDTAKQYKLYKEHNTKDFEDYTYNRMIVTSVLESLGYDVENNMGTYYFISYIMNYITGEAFFNHSSLNPSKDNNYNNAYIRKRIKDALDSFDESKRDNDLYNQIVYDEEILRLASEPADSNSSSILLRGLGKDSDVLAYGIAKYAINLINSRDEIGKSRVKTLGNN